MLHCLWYGGRASLCEEDQFQGWYPTHFCLEQKTKEKEGPHRDVFCEVFSDGVKATQRKEKKSFSCDRNIACQWSPPGDRERMRLIYQRGGEVGSRG